MDFNPRPLSVSLRLICHLSILAVILITKGNEKHNRKPLEKGKQKRVNTTDKNKEQIDFVHKPNQHLAIGLFIL